MTLLEFFSLLISLYLTYIYVTTNFWIANNIFAVCFAIYTIENWLVGNFRHFLLISVGLILYDVYFVFHSDVMMTVAKGVDLPIKILIPLSS
jgi:minor histocompatibility antigen H13